MSAVSPSEELTIVRHIGHEEEKSYYVEIPFEMPEHTEELYVEMTVAPLGVGHCVIDLGVTSPVRVRGWSGGARTAFRIGPERATPGYLAGELTPGRWSVLLGAYRVPQEGCRVEVRIRCQPRRQRWLKGDLHAHTVHSDGRYTLAEAARIMEELGCDFLATTDHNTSSQNFVLPKDNDLVFIPGFELTTNDGHANFLGAADPIDDFRVRDMADIRRHFLMAKERGARRVLNHIKCDRLPWNWDFDVDYDYVEIWNGLWAERNQRALDWWQRQLAAGRRVVAVGGSDVHAPGLPVRHAEPTTWVYADSRTGDGILRGLDQGHAFVSCSPTGPTIDFHIGSAMMGDALDAGELGPSGQAELALDGLESGDRVDIVSERGVEERLTSTAGGSMTHAWTVSDRRFYRVEIWRRSDAANGWTLAAVGNPIYLTGAGVAGA